MQVYVAYPILQLEIIESDDFLFLFWEIYSLPCSTNSFLVSNMLANERTSDAEEIAFVKDASAKLNRILENVNDREAKKLIT